MEPLVVDGGGIRLDEGKPRVDLIPADALIEIGYVYGYGARPGGPGARNWERGMAYSKMIGPALRHIFKFMMGSSHDDLPPVGSGRHHLACAAFSIMGALAYELRGIGKDDRSIPIKEAAPCSGSQSSLP